MNEVSFKFGSQQHLSATLTLPPGEQPARMGVVLLNVGIIHRIGPHRFNAKLARALAREGLATLRMDLSGQGDSGAPDEALPYEQQAVVDLQAAMDHFQRICNIDTFAIAGMCSGACNGLAAALADKRVGALWMLDGDAYPTARTRWNRYTGRLREAPLRTLKAWTRKLVERTARAIKNVANRSTTTHELWDFDRRAPPREVFGRDVQTLVDRGVAVCFVYSGSIHWTFNYQEQLREAFSEFNFVDRVQCEYLPQADHTATTLATQERLIRSIVDWLHGALACVPSTTTRSNAS
ncbi:alpha/beta fold hydrolase [Hydrogenophaga sp. 2FB]|uniref:alpha/beta fold hydrolase n=1 Tax=Hydrogenophaga sp. 2FB TaxID=2502187 RepID=UPI0010F6EF72|nr:alpha/beta fold hydrolase [Hydrogenophaga sp. 2FB]